MSIWTKNNRACTTLWSTLFTMDQLGVNFNESGRINIRDLTFFNNLAGGDLRTLEIEMIADQLDNVFRNARGAKYENGVDRAKAFADLINVLSDPEKTVEDLAETVDALYFFWGE